MVTKQLPIINLLNSLLFFYQISVIASKKLGAIQKGLTPTKINKNIHSPKIHSTKKKTFLQNEGASIQAFRSFANHQKTISTPALKKKLQIYEDTQPIDKLEEEMIKMEYNRKPVVDGTVFFFFFIYIDSYIIQSFDLLVSDDEFEFTNDQVDKLIFGLPTNNCTPLPKIETPKMLNLPLNDPDDLFGIYSIITMICLSLFLIFQN